jgi:hypothetical protein
LKYSKQRCQSNRLRHGGNDELVSDIAKAVQIDLVIVCRCGFIRTYIILLCFGYSMIGRADENRQKWQKQFCE